MINLILCPYPKEASSYIYKEIENDLKNSKKSFLIVPENYTLQSDVDFINKISYKSVIDAKVLSFSSLSSYILDRIGKSDKKTLTNMGKTILLTKILQDLDSKLSLFKSESNNLDFVKDISTLISNIKDYNFDDNFFDSIEKEDIDPSIKLKFSEVKMIFDAYQKESKDLYEDSEDRISYVSERLGECDFLKGSNFYFDKFDDLSDLRLEFISNLLKLGINVNLSINIRNEAIYGESLEIFDQAKSFIKKLGKIDKLNFINLEQKNEMAPDILHLLNNFDSFNPKSFNKKLENISILESTSTSLELENIALMINKAIIRGERYKDFVLVMTSAQEYENQIKRIFARYDIPVFFDKNRKLSENHIIKTWLSLLRIVCYNFKKEDIFYFVRSGIFDFGENSYDKIIDFQAFVDKRKIKGNMLLNDKYFELDETFYEDSPLDLDEKRKENENVNYIRKVLLDLISPLLDFKNGNFKAIDIAKNIFEVLDNGKFKKGIKNYQEILSENNKIFEFEENKQIWDKFIDILDQMVTILDKKEISFRSFLNLLDQASKSTTISIIPPSKDHLLVTDFSKDRVNERKNLIVVGMNDVFFPTNRKKEFLINDLEKDKLREKNIDLKIYDYSSDNKDILNLYRMFGSSEKIFLSFALSDKENSAINKSLSLSEIESIFPKLKIIDLGLLDIKDKKYSKDMMKKYALGGIWKIIKKDEISKQEKEISRAFLEYIKKSDDFDIIKKGIFYTNDKNPLDKITAKKLYKKNKWSVSEIENYSKCPYRYFLNYGIRAKDADSYDVDYLEIGNIVHENIENLSNKLKGFDPSEINEETIEKILKEDFDEILKKNLDKMRRGDFQNKFVLKNTYSSSLEKSKGVFDQLSKGEFKIEASEERFAKDGNFEEVYVDDENYLEGRIDRIDRYKDFVRIIDYKTGKKEFKLVNVLNGIDLQLVVYMISTRKRRDSDKNGEYQPIAAFYLPLKDKLDVLNDSYSKELIQKSLDDEIMMEGFLVKIDDKIMELMDRDFSKSSSVFKIKRGKENIFSPEDDILLEDFVKDLISKSINEIKNGNISLNPIFYNQNVHECILCKYRGVCKIDYSIDKFRFKELDQTLTLKDLRDKKNEWFCLYTCPRKGSLFKK